MMPFLIACMTSFISPPYSHSLFNYIPRHAATLHPTSMGPHRLSQTIHYLLSIVVHSSYAIP